MHLAISTMNNLQVARPDDLARAAEERGFESLWIGEHAHLALPRERAPDEAVVFMGHGTEHPANSAYCQMANILAEDHKNVFMGTVEGYPTFEDVLEDLKESKVKNVRLMPFMIVAGDHALNDLTGNESDSWKSMFEKEGFHVDFNLKGMGENDGIAEIFVQHTKEAFKEFR